MEEFVCINKNQSGSQYEFKIYKYGEKLWADPELIEGRKNFETRKAWDIRVNGEVAKAQADAVPDMVKMERMKKKLAKAEAKASAKEKAPEATYQEMLIDAKGKGYTGSGKKEEVKEFLEGKK